MTTWVPERLPKPVLFVRRAECEQPKSCNYGKPFTFGVGCDQTFIGLLANLDQDMSTKQNKSVQMSWIDEELSAPAPRSKPTPPRLPVTRESGFSGGD